MEHRWGERIRVDLPVRLTSQHPLIVRHVRLTNLSVSGAFIREDAGLRLWSTIKISLDLPRLKCDAPVLAAYTSRKHKDGVGIEWCEFAPPAICELLKVLSARKYIHVRKPETLASLTISRLSAPLLKHGT